MIKRPIPQWGIFRTGAKPQGMVFPLFLPSYMW